MKSVSNTTIAIIGLGYVGLPLAVTLGKKYPTIGYHRNENKISSFRQHVDNTGEVSQMEFEAAIYLNFTADPTNIAEADFIIVTVPTPIDAARRPDLGPLRGASEIVGKHLKKGAVVIYESTVYPGVTEEVCVPILEEASGLVWKHDFHVGYSPERINPGDQEHILTKIVKVVSADDEKTLDRVAGLYESIIDAGVYRVSSIKEAEADKKRLLRRGHWLHIWE